MRSSARLDDDVETDTVCQLEEELSQLAFTRVDRLVGSQSRGCMKAIVVDVDGHDSPLLRSARGGRDDERTDAAGTDHRDGIIGAHTDARHRVKRDSEWLRHGGRVVVAGFRDAPADARRRSHELGEASIHLQTERSILSTEVGSTEQAPAALAARDARAGYNAIADVESYNVASALDHLADKLMPKDDARPAKDRSVIPLRRVSTANGGAHDLEDDLIVARSCGIRDVLDLYVAWPVEDRGPHALNTRSEP